jgi:hypothetical protein
MITRLLALVTLAVLTLAPMQAWAECAWVLWAEERDAGLRGWWNGPRWMPDSGFQSREACERFTAVVVRGLDKDGKPIMEKDPLEGRRGLGTKWRCLPDTIDPRGPKR